MTKEYKFKVGQKVKIANAGMRYSCYQEWSNKNSFELASSSDIIDDGAIGTVFVAGEHCDSSTNVLYGVHYEGNNFILDEQGLEAAEEKVHAEYTYPEIKVGDWVKVVRKVRGYDKDGMAQGVNWCNTWDRDMDKCIGHNYRVVSIDKESGVKLDTSLLGFQYEFPLAALELDLGKDAEVTQPSKPAVIVVNKEEIPVKVKRDLSSKYVMHFNIEIDNLRELRDLLLEIETIKNRIFK